MSSALKRNGSTTRWRKLREQVLIRDGRMCVTCGADEGLQVDHIVERQHGGTDHMDNLQTLCETCHDDIHKKGSKQKKVRTSKGQKIIEM